MITSAIAALVSCTTPKDMKVKSPDGKISVVLQTGLNGTMTYSVHYQDKPVLIDSRLGILRPDADFSSGLRVMSVSPVTPVSDSYTLLYGKKKDVTYKACRKVFSLRNSTGDQMDVIFQVSDDGVAFCYSFPGKSDDIKSIEAEMTSFSFASGTTGWIQPRAAAKTGWNQCNPSYEEHYLEEVLLADINPDSNGWVFPALFHCGDIWVNLTESWPERNYCGSHLNKGNNSDEMIISFPEKTEGFTGGSVYPVSKLPWTTPWRIIALGDNPGVIVESTIGTDVAKPAMPGDFSYVKPGRAAWSWALMKDQSVNYEVQKRFIAYASEMGWEYCLVDVNWDTTIGWNRIEDLALMAKEKNVGLILWYNSAGDWNTVPYHPKDKLLTHESRSQEFTKLEAIGIKGIKVDFFGGDGQSMMDYYQDILADAHEHHLMVNCHGSTLPRGLQRTWPNLVSMEAIRGFEHATFGQDNADKVPSKATTVMFTRNAFDPMDFTPVCFTSYDNYERVTGNGAELAMAVLFLSGVQHYAETPDGMSGMPSYVRKLMSAIPVSWDETRYVDGYPGRYVVIARRTGNVWYVAAVNAGKEQRELMLEMPFIELHKGIMVTEGDTKRSFRLSNADLGEAKKIKVNINPEGGFVMRFYPAETIKPENE